MTRVFDRGELKRVLLAVVESLGEGHGYAIMQELQRRVGGNWRASPGAIYPALVALEGEGLISGSNRDGLRVYRATAQGEAALEESAASPSWEGLLTPCGSEYSRQYPRQSARSFRGPAVRAETASGR